MSRNFKKIFFSSLLAVLFIVSNLIGLKYTNFLNMVVSVNFVTYPFISLCVLLLLDMFSKKDTYCAITSCVFIQIMILLSYVLAINLGNQVVIPDMASSVNEIFMLNEIPLLASLIGFIISNYILIYLYEYFTLLKKKFIGVSIGTLISLIVYGLIYLSISFYNYGINILFNLLLGYMAMSVIMTIIIVILFYILKDKENIYEQKNIFINDINIKSNDDNKLYDKPILEVISIKEEKEKKKNFKKSKSSDNKKTSSKTKKSDNNKKKTAVKRKKNDNNGQVDSKK